MKKIDKRASLIFFAVTLIAAVFTRCVQWCTVIDSQTGFFAGSSFAKNLLTIVIIVGAAIFSLIVLFGGTTNVQEGKVSAFTADRELLIKRTSVIFASISAICGMFIIWELFVNFDAGMFDGKIKTWLFDAVAKALQALSGVVFIVTAYCQYTNKPISTKLGYSYLIPTMWVAIRAANLFKNTAALTSNSQNMLKMMYLLSAILFFVYTARFFAGFEKKQTRKIILITAMLTSVFGFTTIIPAYIYGSTAVFYYDASFFETDLFISIFAIGVALIFLGKDIEEEPVIVEKDEEIIEEIEEITTDFEDVLEIENEDVIEE